MSFVSGVNPLNLLSQILVFHVVMLIRLALYPLILSIYSLGRAQSSIAIICKLLQLVGRKERKQLFYMQLSLTFVELRKVFLLVLHTFLVSLQVVYRWIVQFAICYIERISRILHSQRIVFEFIYHLLGLFLTLHVRFGQLRDYLFILLLSFLRTLREQLVSAVT